MNRLLQWSLLSACGAGIYVSWIQNEVVWYGFAAIIFLLGLIWATWQLSKPEDFRVPPVLLPLTGTLLWGGVQLLFGWSIYAFATQTELLRWGVYAALLLLSYRLFNTPALEETFTHICVWYSFLLTLVSLVQFYSGSHRIFWLFLEVTDPKFGPFLNRDHYATFMILVIPMALYDGVRATVRVSPLVISGLLYASVIASQSRAGSVLATSEVFIFFLLLRLKGRAFGREMRLASIVLFATSTTLILVVGWEPLIKRFSPESDLYRNERKKFIATSWQMLQARPVTGFGLGTWTLAYPQFATYDNGKFVNAAHCDWAQWADDGGLPMLGLMICCFGFTLLFAVRVPWTLGLAAVMVHCLVEFPLQRPFLGAIYFCCLGVAAAACRDPLQRRAGAPSGRLFAAPRSSNQEIE